MRSTLTRCEILRGKAKFQIVFQRGEKIHGNVLGSYFFIDRRGELQLPTRHVMGVTVARRIKKAVDRNRIKRLVREAFRLNKTIMPNGRVEESSSIAIVFSYIPSLMRPIELPTFDEISRDVKMILHVITEKTSDR